MPGKKKLSLLERIQSQMVHDDDAFKNKGSAPTESGTSAGSSLTDTIMNIVKAKGHKKIADPEIEQFITKSANFGGLLEPENTNPQFASLFEQIMAQARMGGHQITFNDGSVEYEQLAHKTKIYRPNSDAIIELKEYIATVYNPNIIYSGIINKVNPSADKMKIDPEGELSSKIIHHNSFDGETNVLQQLHEAVINFKDTSIDITGGVVGSYFLEAQRYVEFHVNSEKSLVVKKNLNEKQSSHYRAHTIIVSGNNPLEALFISALELTIACQMLSVMQDGQKELLTMFKDFTDNLQIPVNADLLESYLNHETLMLFIGANLKFDINQLLAAHQKAGKKLDHILPNVEAKTFKIKWGRLSEEQDMWIKEYSKEFKVAMGNTVAGFKTKILHNKKWGKDGKPEITFTPVQKESDKKSHCTDIRTIAHSCLKERADLDYLAKGTAFEKLKDQMSDEDLMFHQHEFHLVETPKKPEHSDFSKASNYLWHDCMSTLSAYGSLTKSLSLEPIEQKTDACFDYLRRKEEPLSSLVISTATLSKQTLFAKLMAATGIQDLRVIWQNIKTERIFFNEWTKITETFIDKDGETVSIDNQLYFAGRIESPIYGGARPLSPEVIRDLDFKAQYPYAAWLTLAWLKLQDAAKGILHKRQISDIKVIESRFWEAQEHILQTISQTRKIPFDKIYLFSGILQVDLKASVLIRSNTPEIIYKDKKEQERIRKKARKTDKYKKGNQYMAMAELSHALIRLIESNKKTRSWSVHRKLAKMKSIVTFISGNTLVYEANELPEYSKEIFTEFVEMRDAIRYINDEEGNKYKIIVNSAYGDTAEGVSKDDYSGKLYIDPVPIDLVAIARWMNNMLDIYAEILDIQTLYQHTDSGYVIGLPEKINELQYLFEDVDPLESDLQKKKALKNVVIDWFGCWGKSKNAYHYLRKNETVKDHKHKFKCKKCLVLDEKGKPVLDKDKPVSLTWDTQLKCPKCKEKGESLCFKYTTHGSGTYSWQVDESYLSVITSLYEGKTLDEACQIASKLFPISYRLTINKERSNFMINLRNFFKETQLIEVLPFKKGYILVYEQDKIDNRTCPKCENKWKTDSQICPKCGTKSKSKPKKSKEKLYITTTELFKGKFGSISTIMIRKMDKKAIRKRKILEAEIRKKVKEAKYTLTTETVTENGKEVTKTIKEKGFWNNWKGYGRLIQSGNIQSMQKALKNNAVPSQYRPAKREYSVRSKSITKKARNYSKKFKRLSYLEIQSIIDRIDTKKTEIEEFFDRLDPENEFDEIDAYIDQTPSLSGNLIKTAEETFNPSDSDKFESDLDSMNKTIRDIDSQFFHKESTKADLIEFTELALEGLFKCKYIDESMIEHSLIGLYEQDTFTQAEFNKFITLLNVLSSNKPSQDKKAKRRKYISPYPEACNKIIIYSLLPGSQEEFIQFILKNSKSIKDHEKLMLEEELIDKTKGYRHLKSRFSFTFPKYQRIIHEDDMIAINEVATADKHQRLLDGKQTKVTVPSTVTKMVYQDQSIEHVRMVPDSDGTKYRKTQKLPDYSNDNFNSDGVRFTASFPTPNLKFNPKTMGDKNKSITQVLTNIARTLSCKYVDTHVTNKTKKSILKKRYLFSDDVSTLPVPRKSGVRSEQMKGGTVRAKLKFYPLFLVAKYAQIEQWVVNITLHNHIEKLLDDEHLIKLPDGNYQINDSDKAIKTIKNIIKKIRKRQFTEVAFYDKKWIVEIKEFNSGEANAQLLIGIITGKNHVCNCSLRINLASTNLINYNLVPYNKTKLQEESKVVKDLLLAAITTNRISIFTRNSSLNIEDIRAKKNPAFVMDAVTACLAQILIEDSALNGIATQLSEFHLTEDLDAGSPEVAQIAVRLFNWTLQDVYEKQTRNIDGVAKEFKFRNQLSIGQSKQGDSAFLTSYISKFADLAYHKGYRSFIAKAGRAFHHSDKELNESILKEAKEVFKEDKGIVRVEKQLKSFKTVNDPFHYTMFKRWISLMKDAIELTKKLLSEGNNFLTEFIKQTKELFEPLREYLNTYIDYFYMNAEEYKIIEPG